MAFSSRTALGASIVGALGIGMFLLGRVLIGEFSPVTKVKGLSPAEAAQERHPSYLYGRVTMRGGSVYEGRLRFGRNEEAFWDDYFNGFRSENIWARHTSLRTADTGDDETHPSLRRPLLTRFGDVTRLEKVGDDIVVTLKSGATMNAAWGDANDFDDGVRVWDATAGVVDLNSLWIRSIEFLATPSLTNVDLKTPHRLFGVVRSKAGEFRGFVQWNRQKSLGSDVLRGESSTGERDGLLFEAVRSIARASENSVRVTRKDGTEVELSGSSDAGGENHRGAYVDDPRYGRVLVSWEAFERVVFEDGGSGRGYDDFPPGRALRGSVTTTAGRVLKGRIVFDLDESETTETFDAPANGVDYQLPFGLIASIDLAPAPTQRRANEVLVALTNGEQLRLRREGDLTDSNAGALVFADETPAPEYVPWGEIARIDFTPLTRGALAITSADVRSPRP